jgi:SAM-dependent methyltransferase
MGELAHDQRPESWSTGAAGYAHRFEGFTALYADPALDLLGVGGGTRVLDVACGTGVVTGAALARGATVVATDFAAGMVTELVRCRRRRDGSPPAAAAMDAQALGVADRSVDVAVSMFGVMFAPELRAGVGEMVRTVRPGGVVGVGTFDLAAFPLPALVGAAVARTRPGFQGGGPPTWAELGTSAGLGDALSAAGLVDVDVEVISRRWRFTDAEGFFRDGPTWSPPLRGLLDQLSEDQLAAAAGHFAELVAEASGAEGVATDALLGVGRVPGGGGRA